MRLSILLSGDLNFSLILEDFIFNPSLSVRANAEKAIIQRFSSECHIPELPKLIESSGAIACVSVTQMDVAHFKKFFEEKEKENVSRDDIMRAYLSEHSDKLLLDIVLR